MQKILPTTEVVWEDLLILKTKVSVYQGAWLIGYLVHARVERAKRSRVPDGRRMKTTPPCLALSRSRDRALG